MSYDVVRKIGEGGQGSCYLVRHRRSGERVVMKKVKSFKEFRGQPLEVRILYHYIPRHPRILKLLDYSYRSKSLRHSKELTTFYQYYPGGTLGECMREARIEYPPEMFVWK